MFIINEQADFRPRKSCTSQLLNLTQHINDGYQENMITGTAFVDLSAAYDTMNHCCLPSETYGRKGATPIFRSFFTEMPVPPQAAGVVGTFNVLDIYPSEHYGLSFFGPYGCHFFYKVSFFCIHFHFASTLCMCVMYLTSIWRIILMTDGLNAVWSNDRAAPQTLIPRISN